MSDFYPLPSTRYPEEDPMTRGQAAAFTAEVIGAAGGFALAADVVHQNMTAAPEMQLPTAGATMYDTLTQVVPHAGEIGGALGLIGVSLIGAVFTYRRYALDRELPHIDTLGSMLYMPRPRLWRRIMQRLTAEADDL